MSPQEFVPRASDFKGKKLHLSNETVPAMGKGNENAKKAMTTAIGTGKNINISGAAFGAENHALEKDVDYSEKRGRDIYVAKRRAKRRARQKKCMAAQKADDGMERVRAKKKRKNPCDDGPLHLPNCSPRECLPSQEEMLCLLVKGLPFVPSPTQQKKSRMHFVRTLPMAVILLTIQSCAALQCLIS